MELVLLVIHPSDNLPSIRHCILILCVALATVTLTGCGLFNIHLPAVNGPGYTIDGDAVGTGRQAIHPRNDNRYWNGEPMDLRRD